MNDIKTAVGGDDYLARGFGFFDQAKNAGEALEPSVFHWKRHVFVGIIRTYIIT